MPHWVHCWPGAAWPTCLRMPPTMRRRLAFSPPFDGRPLLRFAGALAPAQHIWTRLIRPAMGEFIARRVVCNAQQLFCGSLLQTPFNKARCNPQNITGSLANPRNIICWWDGFKHFIPHVLDACRFRLITLAPSVCDSSDRSAEEARDAAVFGVGRAMRPLDVCTQPLGGEGRLVTCGGGGWEAKGDTGASCEPRASPCMLLSRLSCTEFAAVELDTGRFQEPGDW